VRRAWAVARHMIAEGIRMKIAVVFMVALAALMVVLPFVCSGDGTLSGRVQAFLAYSLGATGFLLSMLTIFLSCGSLANEISRRQIHLIVSKPIPRWQFILGKWLGIMVLDAGLLIACGVVMYGAVWYLKRGEPMNRDDAYRLRHEVLTARFAAPLDTPDFGPVVERQYQRLREQGRLPIDADAAQVKKRLRKEMEARWRSVPPGTARAWTFRELRVVRGPDAFLHIRYKPRVSRYPPQEILRCQWIVGDPGKGAKQVVINRADVVERVHVIPVPTETVAPDGTLRVVFANVNPEAPDLTFPTTVTFEGDDGLQVLYRVGTFGGNLVRALAIVYCRLAFLAALGLLASSFLSFPVACTVCLLVYFSAIGAGFLSEALGYSARTAGGEQDPLGVLGDVLRPLARGFLWLIPDFSKFDPAPTLVDGRNVTLMWVLVAIGQLVLLRTVIAGLTACVVFHYRELAQVVV